MADEIKVRWGWLRFMYVYTALGAGGLGLGVLFAPALVQALLGFPDQDPVVFGVVGSVYAAFGFISLLALRAPLKFSPLLLLQLCYKILWVAVIALPLAFSGHLPAHGALLLVIFATYIIGDLIAIPFPYLFATDPGAAKKQGQ